MRILVCEHFTAEGHANLFVNVCKLLVQGGYEVIAVVPQNFTKDLSFCDVRRMDLRYYSDEYPQGSGLKKMLYSLRVQKYVSKLYKKEYITATFVVTYDEIALAIGTYLGFIKGIFFVFQNNNPDKINISQLHRFSYNLIKNRVYSVVLGGFIKDFLVSSLSTNPGKVLVLPHPMNLVDNNIVADIDCVGISNSNDESIIEKIINLEIEKELFKKNDLKVLLKSQKHKFNNGNLVIISGFIDASLYDDYIARAKCILIPFPNSFNYRISGTLIDALSNRKNVIGTSIPVITQSSKIYKSVIRLFDESNFINDIMPTVDNIQFKNEDFNRFQEQHSENLLTKILSNAIENAIDNRPMVDAYDF